MALKSIPQQGHFFLWRAGGDLCVLGDGRDAQILPGSGRGLLEGLGKDTRGSWL